MQDKQTLRKQIKTELSKTKIKKHVSQKICAGLEKLPQYMAAKTVFAFVPLPTEIDINPFLKKVLADGKTLCLPRCTLNNGMEACVVTDLENLQKATFGILEPSEICSVLQKEKIDFAVLPCYAVSPKGVRLGKGGGYYDRFLQNATFTKIAVCCEKYIRADIPSQPHDIGVDIIVTEKNSVYI